MYQLKSTGQQVFEIKPIDGRARDGYTTILRPFGHVSKAGNRGEVVVVRDDKLTKFEQ